MDVRSFRVARTTISQRPQQTQRELRNGATVKLWNVASGDEIRSIDNHWDALHSVAFSPDGRSVLASGYMTLRMWDAATGEEIRNFAGGRKPAAFAPEGATILSASTGDALKFMGCSDRRVRAATRPSRTPMRRCSRRSKQ
jgi:WD40 repeat protein